MAIATALYSRVSEEWSTPQKLFDQLHAEFNFDLDPCASALNAKCVRYYTKADNGLSRDWGKSRVFMNPPYGHNIGQWMAKAVKAWLNGATVVCLIPARTDTQWFCDWVIPYAQEIRFIRGRVHFSNSKQPSPFPSLIVVYKHDLAPRSFSAYIWRNVVKRSTQK